jgi:TP901 family phage tail tape measure protein
MGVATMRVPTIFTAVDRFSGVVSKMTAATSAFGRTAEAAAMRTSRRFNSAGTTMLYTGAAIATGLGYAVNEAVKFEKAMATVSTTIDNTTPEMMARMGQDVLNMSKIIPKPLSELTEGLYDVVSAGIDAKYAMTVLDASGRLAVAGLGTTQQGVDILTSSLNSFNMEGTESANISNMVFKAVKYGKTTVDQLSTSFGNSAALIKNSNVSLAEYLATTAVLTTTGMSASRAQTQVASAVTALIKPAKSMSLVLAALGAKDIPEFIKKNGGLVKTLRLVRDQADKMGILNSKAFGRKEGFNAMLSLLGPLNDEYLKVMKDMTGGTDTLTESFDKQQNTTAAGFQRLKNNATILAITIGDQLLPRINEFVARLTPTVEGITEWTKRNSWLSSTLLKASLALLILGAVAKVGAVLFYGLGKAIAFATWLSGTYEAITLGVSAAQAVAALTGESLTAVLWSMAAAELAVLWPVLLIVAALGLLAYAMFDSIGSTEDMVSKQIGSLDRKNSAWENSTKIQARELNKQKGLMETHNPNVTGARIGMDKNIAGIINKNQQDKADRAARLATVPIAAVSKNTQLFSNGAPAMASDAYRAQRDAADKGPTPKNLAGSNQLNVNQLMKDFSGKNGELNINIKDPGGVVESVDESNTGGIAVKTTSTTGKR